MNLFEMLDGYKTNPDNEIRKINSLLKKNVGYFGQSIWGLICISFDYSELNKIETDLPTFYNNFVLKNPCYSDLSDDEVLTLQYRFICELIYNLLYVGETHGVLTTDAKEICQIKGLIENGLKLCGYKMEYIQKHYITKKVDIHAETIATANKEYKDYIFDYLIAKTISDKENALINLCNKLEAIKTVDGYTKHTRDYIQLLRHPDERKNKDKYSWFYQKQNYPANLDKLFKILLTYIAHLDSYQCVKEFDEYCSSENNRKV